MSTSSVTRSRASLPPMPRNKLLTEFYHCLQSNQLILPTIPEISFKIRRAINDKNASTSKIARVVQIDPSITARLIQIANSPLYRGRKQVDSCPEALTRLGLKTAQNIITAFSLKSVFNAKSPFINHQMIELWKHSSYVAAISAIIAHKISGFDPDRAMLAGLIHDIGIVPILMHADRYIDAIAHSEDLVEVTKQLRADTGVEILRQWDFPADFEDVVINAENWHKNDNKPLDYADIVMIAQLHSLIGKGDTKTLPNISGLPIYKKLASHLQIDDSISILDKAKNEMEYIWSLLN
ncbi:MAG: HDOD domain-containing protein [Methylosarcina sp.]